MRPAPRSTRCAGAASRLRVRPATTPSANGRWDSASSTTSRSPRAGRRPSSASQRVAIVDWDVHHGNGTQDVVAGDESILFVSLHQWPLYPGTGGPDEQGPNLINIPLPAGTGDGGYLAAWETVARAVEAFVPDLLLVSAGFDAHVDDPLANMEVSSDGFRDLARRATQLAPRVAAVLEGGYNLKTLPDLVESALEGFTD